MSTILVVDDNVDQMNISSTLLEKLGYRVFRASDGKSALDIVEKNHIDVLFTDFIMPGKTRSVDLAYETKKKYPKAVVIFTSGYPTIDTMVIGDAVTINKPYDIRDVDELIRREMTKFTE